MKEESLLLLSDLQKIINQVVLIDYTIIILGGEMMEKKVYIDLPPFTGRNVPIKEIAQAIGKDPHYIRLAIQQGIFKFGVAMKVGNSNEFSYYCPDRKVWEETGYFRDVRKEKAQA